MMRLSTFKAAAAAASLTVLAGCSVLHALPFVGSAPKPKPAELQANPNLLAVREAWTARIGKVDFPLVVGTSGNVAALAASDGTVLGVDAGTGREQWRGTAGAPLAAGVGFDGSTAAVVTRNNDLVAFASGREVWRQRLAAQSYTPPLVAGARVFVLGADRSVSAFDGGTGRRLWTQTRTGEPLVLRQAGVLIAVGDTLVVGLSGRLVGMNPINGSSRWEVPLATPRGINDIERLVDLVGRVSRVGDSVCARSFQATVGCVDAARGQLQWSQRAVGVEGVHGDGSAVYGTEGDGKVVAFKREDGQRAWSTEALLHRGLTAPLALGRSVVVGDGFGYVHMLSRTDGSLLQRLSTGTAAIATAPTAIGSTLLVVTRDGGVHAYVPQ